MIPVEKKFYGGLLSVLIMLGCSGHPDRPATYPVSGTVHLNGKPVEGANVVFYPKTTDPSSKSAGGQTDAQGLFSLQTYFSPTDNPEGTLADEYIVVITKIDAPKEPIKNPVGYKRPTNQLPDRYSSVTQSTLSATVTAEGRNSFTFELQQ